MTPLSWEYLMLALHGARVATTTTLLAALWPGDHVVFDRRVHWAANALRICSQLDTTQGIDPGSSRWRQITLNDYVSVRRWIVKTADLLRVRATAVERTLYILDQQIRTARGETWQHYAERLGRLLATAAG